MLSIVLDNDTQLHLLMLLPLNLDVQALIFLELPHHLLLPHLHHHLHPILIAIGGVSSPGHLLYQIVLGNINCRTPESHANDKSFSGHFLAAVIKIQVNEALHHKLLELFVPGSGPIDQLDLLLQLRDVACLQRLVANAPVQLLMNNLVSKPSDWRSKVSIKIQTESEVSFVDVELASVNCIFLDVHSLVEEELLEFVVELFFLEQFFKFLLQVHHVVCLEPDSQV